jgi:hypothetical protein
MWTKKAKALGRYFWTELNLTTNIYICGVMNLIIRHISFIKEKDLNSKIEKTAVRMAYRNYNSSGLESK